MKATRTACTGELDAFHNEYNMTKQRLLKEKEQKSILYDDTRDNDDDHENV